MCAFFLWWLSNQLVVIGPPDRTAFRWLVVVPILASVPTVGGIVFVARLWSEDRLGAVLAGLAASAAGYVLLAIVLGLSFQPLCNRP